jgi:hypothetical protein
MRAYRRISTELHALIEETRSCLFLWDGHGICARPVQPRRKRHKGKHNAQNEEACSVHRGDDHYSSGLYCIASKRGSSFDASVTRRR